MTFENGTDILYTNKVAGAFDTLTTVSEGTYCWNSSIRNHPNPFNSTTTISIYNILGQKVRTLVNENRNAGEHSAIWDCRDSSGQPVGSGIYFCRLESEKVGVLSSTEEQLNESE